MTDKIMFSEILNIAADNYLQENSRRKSDRNKYSCDAVTSAVIDMMPETSREARDEVINPIADFLRELGCPTGSCYAFKEYEKSSPAWTFGNPTVKSQAYRYSWLKFAAQIAKEEGLCYSGNSLSLLD